MWGPKLEQKFRGQNQNSHNRRKISILPELPRHSYSATFEEKPSHYKTLEIHNQKITGSRINKVPQIGPMNTVYYYW